MSSSNTHNGQNHHHHGQLITLLHNLGSKEVECHVQLTVHSVSDLPVKSGRFRVRWKFRDIDAKLAKQHRKAAAALKAKEHQSTPAMMSQAAGQTESQATSTAASSSDTEDKDTSTNDHTPKDTNSEQPRPRTASTSPNAVEYSSEDHGQTDYVRMRKRDHSVTYERTIDVIARMRVYKGELNSEPLKLVVEQLPNEINSESYRGPALRIGHRHINLAEFVSEGKLRRKYLLESSKTNAMISVSLDITVIKAQAEFTKPVLRQDHILIGRKESPSHPRSVTGSTHPTSTTVVLSRPSLDQSSASASTVSSTSSSSRDSAPRPPHPTPTPNRSPPSTQLSTVNDIEATIEALFNPLVFSSSTHAFLPASNKMKSQSILSGRSVTTAATTTAAEHSIINSLITPYEYPDSRSSSGARAHAGSADVGEFGALRHGSADGHSAGVGMETSVTRRPSVATTSTSASTSSGGWGGDDEQNQNQSHRGRLLSKLKNPFTVTRRSMTPTPGGTPSSGDLNSSSTSIGGRKRSSLDIVYPAPVSTSDGSKTPTLTADNGVATIASAPQGQRQMYHPSMQTRSRFLLSVPVHAR